MPALIASSVLNTNQPSAWLLPTCDNGAIPACSFVSHPLFLLLLFLLPPLRWSRAPPPDPTPRLAVGCLHPVFLSWSRQFFLSLLYCPLPPCLCPLPPWLSLSLILLCGGFAVGSPRHEWSISRSPGGSSPYYSVQWAWIVSQSTQVKPLCKHCHFAGCILTV